MKIYIYYIITIFYLFNENILFIGTHIASFNKIITVQREVWKHVSQRCE